MLDDERAQSERACNDLVSRVSGMLVEYTQQRDQSLRKTVDAAQSALSTSQAAWTTMSEDQGSRMDTMISLGTSTTDRLGRRKNEGKRKREDCDNVCASFVARFVNTF